jgi:putative ABC transport system permease protein
MPSSGCSLRVHGALQAAFPQTNEGLTMNAISARDLIVGDVRTPLLMLLGAVGFVLLVACANVASLMLARASARRDEMAVRAALGARRGRLLRQLLTEAVVLGLIGGMLGLALAYAGTEALIAARPADIPRLEEVGLDRTVVFFTFTIALFAGLIFGAVPALQVTGQLTHGLRTGRRGGPDRTTRRVRAGLVVAEVALAVVLLACAGLLLRSLAALTQAPPGFSSDNAVSFRVSLFGRGYDLDAVRARVTEYEAALRALPGVTAVSATSVLPLSGPGPRLAFSVKDAPPPPADVNPEIGVASVTPDYLKTIGARLVMGRAFTNRDRGDAPPVAIVNESAVRRWFPDGAPIGRHVQMGGTREIVGVMADVLQGNPKQQTAPQLLIPYAQRPTRSLWLVVRTAADPRTAAPSIRATIRGFDADLAVSELTLLDDLRTGAIARPRFYAALLALFAAVALVLTVTGIFGVVSYTVAERTREIGVRIALGAHRADVVRMIVGRAVALALIGATIGLAGALALGRVIRNQLFRVDVLDPPTLSVVILILLTSAAAASFLPARRASRLDPGRTLRHG